MTRIARIVIILALGACSRDGTGPGDQQVQLAVLAGDIQFGLPGGEVEEPLQVVATDPVSERTLASIRVDWLVVSGAGAVVTASSTTDSRGVASARLELGPELGEYRVEATAPRLVGDRPVFTAFGVERPVIEAIAPGGGAAGDTITITGRNFNPIADYNGVFFDGVRGRVLSATSTQLKAIVPLCVPTGTVALYVALGAVASTSQPFPASGGTIAELSLARGQARVIADPAELACMRLPGGLADASWLAIAQNVTTIHTAATPFQLLTLSGSAPVAMRTVQLEGAGPEAWEARLRRRERALFDGRLPAPAVAPLAAEPQVGDVRSFRVLADVSGNETVTISAEVRAVSERAVIYLDRAAPAGGFTSADLQNFAATFDDPIYPVTAGVFGNPSDIDANGRIIILLTPRVNALTPRGEPSFIAGYFYGCDLVSRTRCADTNSGEIFYSLVPDPQGQFSDARSVAQVLQTVPPVLAHEFQHMISFAQRSQTLDALWLSEGLAHTAEDIVADAFQQRGDLVRARDFRRPNYLRAHRYVQQIASVSMIAEDGQGSIPQRGGAWLFLRYLRGHYGGNTLLAALTQTTLSSTQNVTTRTGQPWATLLADFALALYADGATELAGVAVPARYTFPDFDPQAVITQEAGSYPLQMSTLTLGSGGISGELPSASSSYLRLVAPAGSSSYPPINMVFAGAQGGPFRSDAVPQLVIMRLR